MTVKELENIKLFSRNGHELFTGKIENIPEYLKSFDVLSSLSEGNKLMINAWVTIKYNDKNQKIVTIEDYASDF